MASKTKTISLNQKAISASSSTNVKYSFFLYPTISREVESVIDSLKTHKVYRFLGVDKKFLKYCIVNLLFPKY